MQEKNKGLLGKLSFPNSQVVADQQHHAKINAEQIRTLYQQALSGGIAHVVVVIGVAIFFWGHSNRIQFYTLIGGLLITAFALYVLARQFKKCKPDDSELPKWGQYYFVLNLLSALFWGASFFLFFDTSQPLLIYFSIFLVTVMNLSSISVLGTHLPCYYSLTICVSAALSLRLIGTADSFYILLGFLVPMQWLISQSYARNMNRTWAETFSLRFQNTQLVNRLQQEIENADQARKEAELANIAKSKFLAAASHDLRQPLHALGLFTAALDSRIKDEETRPLVANIKNASQALEGLFNALLDISKLDAGVIKPNPANFALVNMLARFDKEFDSEAIQQKLDWSWQSEHFFCHSDPILVELILRNLIGNAFRYTKSGKVWVKAREVNEQIEIEVGDTGPGIPADKQKEIFEEFRQLQNPERDRSKGLGLGLAIVDRLCHLLDIELKLESELGHGTLIRFKLNKGVEVKTNSIETKQTIKHSPARQHIILVIDDEKNILESTRALLEQWNYHVVIADSAEAAFETLSNQALRPNAVIVDYRLRDNKTGLDALSFLFDEMDLDVPALIVTGESNSTTLKHVRSSEFPVAHKPVTPHQLREFLDTVT